MRILGIDFGHQRIGLAVSDPMGWTAQGIPTIPNDGKEKAARVLAARCAEYQVEEVVIGLPVNMNGTLGPGAQEILAWVPVLEKTLGVPVRTQDERLTSRQAGRLMREEGLSMGQQKRKSDQMAAMIILQGYLEARRLKR